MNKIVDQLKFAFSFIYSRHRGQLAILSNQLAAANQPVLVLGSAPNTELPEQWNKTNPLITVNGSQAIANSLQLGAPFMSILTAQVIGELPSNRAAKDQLRGQYVQNLIFVERVFPWRFCKRIFRQMEYTHDDVVVISHEQRNWIIHHMLGENLGVGKNASDRISSGLFAITLALYLNAPTVVVAGINPASTGHAYDDKGLPREHSVPDAYALKKLAAKYPNLYAASPDLAASCGLKLWSPDDYARNIAEVRLPDAHHPRVRALGCIAAAATGYAWQLRDLC